MPSAHQFATHRSGGFDVAASSVTRQGKSHCWSQPCSRRARGSEMLTLARCLSVTVRRRYEPGVSMAMCWNYNR